MLNETVWLRCLSDAISHALLYVEKFEYSLGAGVSLFSWQHQSEPLVPIDLLFLGHLLIS